MKHSLLTLIAGGLLASSNRASAQPFKAFSRQSAKGFTSLCIFMGLICSSWGQLYFEDFTGQENQGLIGSSSDFSLVDWTITGDTSGLTANDDFFSVKSGSMTASDTDELLTWISPDINISTYTDFIFSIDLAADGDFEKNQDIFEISYQIDGGTKISLFEGIVDEDAPGDPFTVSGNTLTDDFSAFSTSFSGSGSSLKILVDILNNAGTEFQYFDNVKLSAVGPEIPEPSTVAFAGIGMVIGFLGYRRFKKAKR